MFPTRTGAKHLFDFTHDASRAGIRYYTAIAGEVPENVHNNFSQQFKNAASLGKVKMPPVDSVIINGAQEMAEILKHDCAKGDMKTQQFVRAMQAKISDPNCTAMLLNRVPTQLTNSFENNVAGASYFIVMLSSLMGIGQYKAKGINSFFEVKTDGTEGSRDPIPPHSDQLLTNNPLQYFSLVAMASEGETPTLKFENDVIGSKLQNKDIDILREPIFSYITPWGDRHPGPIVYYDKNGKLNINFDCDMRGFGADFSRTSFPQDEVIQSVHKLLNITWEMYKNDEMEKIFLYPGDAVIEDNTRTLHSRPQVTDLHRHYLRIYLGDERTNEKVTNLVNSILDIPTLLPEPSIKTKNNQNLVSPPSLPPITRV